MSLLVGFPSVRAVAGTASQPSLLVRFRLGGDVVIGGEFLGQLANHLVGGLARIRGFCLGAA